LYVKCISWIINYSPKYICWHFTGKAIPFQVYNKTYLRRLNKRGAQHPLEPTDSDVSHSWSFVTLRARVKL